MKLLFVCNEYPPAVHGGVGSFVYNLAHQLFAQGHSVHVIGYDERVRMNTKESDGGVSVVRLRPPFRKRRYLTIGPYDVVSQMMERMVLSLQTRTYCLQNSIDLVESYDWSGPLWFHPGKPLVVRMHGAHTAYAQYEARRLPRFLKYIEKRNLSMADRLVGVSHHISALTLQAVGLKNRAYSVIYNSVNTNMFHPFGGERPESEALFAGTVARRKGIIAFFSALPRVLEAVPGVKITVVGRLPMEVNEREALIGKLLEPIPVQKRQAVRFIGACPYSEMPGWYNRATCAVFPSLAEAFGLTCVEAMACGTPVLMTSRASGPEIVEDGVSGLLVDPASPASIASAAIRLLKDDDLQHKLSQQGHERVLQCFDQEKIIEQNIKMYRNMLGR